MTLLKLFQAYHPLPNIPCNTGATGHSFNVLADYCSPARTTAAPFAIRFAAFLGGALRCARDKNAWPNLDAALQGDHKAAAIAFVQYTFAFIVAISSIPSAHEKSGQVAVIIFMACNGYFAFDAASARGEMENRIKECQLDLSADRTSAASLRANQLRLWFASLASTGPTMN